MIGTASSAAASSTIAAASGSWKTLNSAAAVALPTRAAPPMKTIRSSPRATSGCIRSSSATFVRGASGTSVTRSPASAAASRTSRSSSTPPRPAGSRGIGVGGGAGRPGSGQPEVTHAVLAVDVPRRPGGLEQRPRRSAPHRDVEPAGGVEHDPGVADDVVHGRVARDAGDRAQVDVGVQRGEQQGAGVVHTGVDVQHEGDRHVARLTGGWSRSVLGPGFTTSVPAAGEGPSPDAVH